MELSVAGGRGSLSAAREVVVLEVVVTRSSVIVQFLLLFLGRPHCIHSITPPTADGERTVRIPP
jgi:hypothetical protein